MNEHIDLQKYSQFVERITSKTSDDLDTFVERLDQINDNYTFVDGKKHYGPEVNIPLLITGAMGLCGESGEFSELVKKMVFHSKGVTPELIQHLNKELGDIIFYWTNACRSIGVDPNQVIADNVAKLEARYPGGKFSAQRAENRAAGDI